MTKTFRRDIERCRRRRYDMELLKTAIRLLEANGLLPAEYRPHKLSGDYAGTWECHIKGNWLMHIHFNGCTVRSLQRFTLQ